MAGVDAVAGAYGPVTTIADLQAAQKAAQKAAAEKTQSSGAQSLGKDAFLKLLVAQLKYQDPMNPSNSTEFMAQTASFTQVEKLEDISSAVSSLVSAQTVLGASGLVGRTVSYTGEDGSDVTGTVSAVRFGAGGATVRVGDTDVAVSAVKEVRSAAG